MSLINVLWPYLGNPIEDGKKAQMDHRLDSLRLYPECDNLEKESRNIFYGRKSKEAECIDGEYSVVEIDGKKLLEEIK
jgi:hypothetical protein